jgi:hypothetical protein
MYGYGKNITQEQNISANPPTPQPQDLPAEPLTFTDVAWSETADHPAKPSGQAYLENPTAKALYGRNGRNRFGFYQNGDVTDPNVLLDLTWKALKKDSEPLISIEGTLHDLQRLGYADQTIRLHDTAIVEVLPAGVEVQREIIQLTVDLLNPLNTTVTIGAYIPNIIYINKETAEKASGGGGGGGGGGRGQTDAEKEFSEFQTQISANQYQILLRAWQQNINSEILKQAGIQLNADGVLIYAEGPNQIGGKIKVQKERIDLVVEGEGTGAEIKAASIALAINEGGSEAAIIADQIYLNGTTIVKNGSDLSAAGGWFSNLYSGSGGGQFVVEGSDIRAYSTINAEGGINALDGATVQATHLSGSTLQVGGSQATWQTATVVTGISRTASHVFTSKNGSDYTGALVTGVSTATISYLGS